jgi:hypothetical protein
MRRNVTFMACTAALALFTIAPANAAFTTVDISSYVTTNFALGEPNYPTGVSTGNLGSPVPFNVATLNGEAATWLASGTGSSLDVKVSVSGQASFYALLNNYFGTAGADEYDITIKTANSGSFVYSSIGGVDTRDYNENVFTNNVAPTTIPWFSNETPSSNGFYQRLDLREFQLPTAFSGDTITDFIITQVNNTDDALFTGLTFSTDSIPVPVPEPVSMAIFGSALLGLGLVRRKRSQ